MSKVIPHLWFEKSAEEAAKLYVSLLPDSHIDSVTTMPSESPSGPPGSVKIVELTLAGQQFVAMDAGPFEPFNHAISFVIDCKDQAEVDRLWDALSQGGKVEQCGWVKDRFGLSWQIVPSVLGEMMKDPDRARAKRVTDAMLKMAKLDIAELQRAYAG
ncbi:MAG: VOC family protein [Deltaproteobacteria bacterium]|nr:VOC family protein [Deltaproteobacteria bacterium]